MKKQTATSKKTVSPQASLVNRVNQFLSGLRRRTADKLNAKTALWTQMQLGVFLGLFLLSFSAASAAVILDALRSPQKAIPGALPVPAWPHPLPGIMLPSYHPSVREIAGIERFRHYLDSLSQTADGRSMYDSINAARPGLTDSIAAVEHIYNTKN